MAKCFYTSIADLCGSPHPIWTLEATAGCDLLHPLFPNAFAALSRFKVHFWHYVAFYEWIIVILLCVKGLVTKPFFFVVVAECTVTAVPHTRARPCGCFDWAARILSDPPPTPQLPLSKPLMILISRFESNTAWSYIYCSYSFFFFFFLTDLNADIQWWNKVLDRSWSLLWQNY